MIVVLFDYGAGNIHSIRKAVETTGVLVRVESDARRALEGDALILPGVGAFGSAAQQLEAGRGALSSALEAGHPCLGICLGLHLLFESSEEGPGAGIGLIPGTVTRLTARRVPHIGWNTVESVRHDPLLDGLHPLIAYFANSYVAEPSFPGDVIAMTDYAGGHQPSVLRRNRTWGVQFHPEKSGSAGLTLLRNFVAEVAA